MLKEFMADVLPIADDVCQLSNTDISLSDQKTVFGCNVKCTDENI